jgi:CheY-like chemotaxis protein
MPTKTVLDVGNCGPDHTAISSMLRKHFDVEILRTDQLHDTLESLNRQHVDLILINRKLDIDYSDGMDVLRIIKQTEAFQDIPVMLITNYAEYQQQAIALGAIPGFGKLELHAPETLDKLRSVLQSADANSGSR